jgi:hypothetical protein
MPNGIIDYRQPENRMLGFKRFYEFQFITNDCSPDIAVETWLSDELNCDFEQRCVLALFHGAAYSGPIETIFAIEFPKLSSSSEQLTEFFLKNRHRMNFSPDCKYRKMVFEKFLTSLCGSLSRFGSLGCLIASCLDSDNVAANYTKLKSLCESDWYHWGRMGHWCFSEALSSFIKAPINPPTMEFADGKSHRSGWAFCINRDDLTGRRISKADCAVLEVKAEEFIAQYSHPNANYFTLETACCNYKRQHKGTRYGGCYIDEQYDDLAWAMEAWPEYRDVWDLYMKGRQKVLPSSLLYETNAKQSFPRSANAYQKSWVHSLARYGRMPRVDAWFSGEAQIWSDLRYMPFAHD